MTPGDRDVLLLFALGELSYGEIAETLDLPVGTVRSRLHRVRKHLRPLLSENHERDSDVDKLRDG